MLLEYMSDRLVGSHYYWMNLKVIAEDIWQLPKKQRWTSIASDIGVLASGVLC